MKQKGFTLIELLAVIVILAIIALIAVPVILNVIEKSKIGAAEQSAQGYVDAVEKQIVTNKVKNENLIEEGEYTKSQLDEKNVKIKGEITDAVLVVGEKGRVTQGRFCINGYSIDYDGKKATKNSEANYCNEINSILNICPYEENQVFNFDYTGDIQEFNPECEGNYKLEVWGAQGGGSNTSGSAVNTDQPTHIGLGGYSVGVKNLEKNEKIYIYVGGQGNVECNATNTINGGWNGGGSGHGYGNAAHCNGGGGGATDIRTKRAEVTYQNYSYYTNDTESLNSRIIVAGGGGGMGQSVSSPGFGGHGGGYKGEDGGYNSTKNYNSRGSTGATQSSGYALGYGGSGYQGGTSCQGGAGGGFYGGNASTTNECNNNGGGGGSGYIGGVTSNSSYGIVKQMTCYSCSTNSSDDLKTTTTSNYSQDATSNYAKSGNGYARITYLGK